MRAADDVRRIRPKAGTERVPPQNLEAEESVLGSMMLSPDAIADVIEIVRPADFYRTRERARSSTPCARSTAAAIPSTRSPRWRSSSAAGPSRRWAGTSSISDLVDRVPTPVVRRVLRADRRRDLAAAPADLGAAADIMDMAYSAPEEPERVADEAEQRIYDVARHDEKDQVASLHELVDEAMTDLERIQNRESAFAGVPTGFRDVDTLLSGMQAGNLIVIAARPGVGKSSFVTNLARNVAVDAGLPVAMFSLEMSRWEIGMRLLCGEARVPVGQHPQQAGRRRGLVPDRAGRRQPARGAAVHRRLGQRHARRHPRQGPAAVGAQAGSGHDHRRLPPADVPHAQGRQPPAGDRRDQPRPEDAREGARDPGDRRHQLNRDPERRQDKRPQLSDLRESGAIEQDADVVMFIHRDDADPAKKGLADLIVAKHRNGPTDTVPLTFLPHLTQFRNHATAVT